jgi:hypothetical protein
MRGQGVEQFRNFSYLSPEQRIRRDHPLRQLRAMSNEPCAS